MRQLSDPRCDDQCYHSPGCHYCKDWSFGEGCISGTWYGYCSSEYCYGMCELLGDCDCDCGHPDEEGEP